MYFAFIKLRNVFLYLREPPGQLFFLGCGGLGGCVEVSWGCSLFFLLTIVFQIISETTKKPPIRCIELSSLSASRRQVCLSSGNWRCDSASCSCPCIQHKDAKDVCTFLSFFFFFLRSGAACTKVSLIPLNMHSKLRNV